MVTKKTDSRSGRPSNGKSAPSAVKENSSTASGAYAQLLAEHQPAPIYTKREYNRLVKLVERYTGPNLTAGERRFLDLVSGLVEKYEQEHFPVPDASPGDVLLYLLDAHSLTQSEFARQIGLSRQFITNLVKQRRSLTGEQIRKFADFFGVSPAVFVPRA